MAKEGFMDELTQYIRKNLKKGYTKESLKWALVNQGYSIYEIERAIERVDRELAAKAPQLESKPIITHEFVEPEMPEVEKVSFWRKLFGK